MARFRPGALSVGLLVCAARLAAAQHEHMLIGSTLPGGGTVVLQYDFTRPTVVEAPSFTSIDPSFAPVLQEDASVPIYPLADGTSVRMEIVALDAGTSVTVNDATLDRAGDGKKIGDAPVLHNHVTWALDVPTGVTGDFHLSFKLTASGPYGDSSVYTITITNSPVPTTTTTSSTTSTVPTTTSTTTSSTTTTTLAVSLDAQLCYRAPLAKGSPPFDDRTVGLVDRFGSAETVVKTMWGACNPLALDAGTVRHPDVGLERMTIKRAKGAPGAVTEPLTVSDALGSVFALALGKPDRLLVPGGMGPAGSPVMVPPDAASGAPGAIHHLQCYRTKHPRGTPKPPPPTGLTVADRFGPIVLDLVQPAALCVPVDAGGDPLATNAAQALVCWRAKIATNTPKPVRRLDARASARFGEHELEVKSIAELCVPATMAP
jgi:hypothetical protein